MGHTASDTDTPRQIYFIATVQMQGTEEVPAEFFCGIFRKRKISQILTDVFAIVNKKPLTSNEISGFWHQLIILLWLQEISLKNEAVAVEVNPYEDVL